MQELYEIFEVLKVQKRTVSAETISGNTEFVTGILQESRNLLKFSKYICVCFFLHVSML